MEASHTAVDAFTRGDPGPLKAIYSRADDVTLANPFGSPVLGWTAVEATMTRAALNFRDGRALGFDHISEVVTPGLAYMVEMERFEAKVGGGSEVVPVTLRVTTVLRPEGGAWRIVHRHADPITGDRAADSVIQR